MYTVTQPPKPRKSKRQNFRCAPGCSVEAALDLFGGKWKGVILYHLCDGTLRFSQLKHKLKNVTQRMLTKQLRELEDDKLIERKVYAVVPPKVEYSLTERGQTLRPLIMALKAWGDEHVPVGPPAVAVVPRSDPRL